jgi:16S rRNA (guanine966-N2)-methyltransferase
MNPAELGQNIENISFRYNRSQRILAPQSPLLGRGSQLRGSEDPLGGGLLMIRLTGGEWRGRLIKVPPGLRTRPTGAKVREALFNMLQAEIDGARFADVCCGGGTVGLEALSRGAEQMVFVESHRPSIELLRRNLATLQASADTHLICAQRAESWALQTTEPFDILFCDPPYRSRLLEGFLPTVSERRLITPGGLLVAEVDAGRDLAELALPGFSEPRHRRHGDTALWLWRREAS